MNDIDDVYASAISDEEGFSDDDGVGIVYESAEESAEEEMEEVREVNLWR